MKRAIVYLYFLTFLSCDNSKESNSSYETIDLTIAKKESIDTQIAISRVVRLESSEHSIIGQINKVLCVDGLIYILDRDITHSLFVFDMEGALEYKITPDPGPGRFISPVDFQIDSIKNHLNILCGGRNKLFTYDSKNGDFIIDKEVPTRSLRFSYANNDSTILFQKKTRQNEKCEIVIVSDKTTTSKFYDWPHNYIPLFHGFSSSGDFISTLLPNHNIVYEFDGNSFIEKYELGLGSASPVNKDGTIKEEDKSTVINIRHWKTQKSLIFNYQLEGKSSVSFYNYDTKNTIVYSKTNFSPGSIVSGLACNLVGATDNELIARMNPNTLHVLPRLTSQYADTLSKYNYTWSNKQKEELDLLNGYAEKVKKTDNPILVFLREEN